VSRLVGETGYADRVSRDDDLHALGVFAEPQRRRVFERLQAAGSSTVGELAEALGMGRTLVVFHLGKLTEAGFVDVVPPTPAGAPGRPPQRYRATGREVAAAVPDRRYDLLAGVLLDGLADHRVGESADASALRVARRRGAELARGLGSEPAADTEAADLARLERVLAALGYAPRRDGAEVVVVNCPFHKFRATNTAQVCSVNRALGEGYLRGLELDRQVQATLRPSPDTCCVAFEPRTA
jgi:predicted ArsR family transcriptional regulator